MNARKLGLPQSVSSTIAEISERTGQRIDGGHHRTNRGAVIKAPARQDPLADVWASELEPMLRREPRLKPTTLYEYLEEEYPGKYQRVLRTLQRRVREWRALHGPEPEVMFMLRHEPRVMGLSDFTKLKEMEITLNGKPFEHLIYHYRLAYSGWQSAQIIQGGESFTALSEGLQNALKLCGGAPQEHRTDSLNAAYRNSDGRRSKELTRYYEDLCEHYRMVPTRNNKGKANENGSVESPHGHLKNRIKQAIYMRGSADFASVADYQAVIDQAAAGLNRQCTDKYEAEKAVLQPLPKRRVADYEILSVKVSCHSTIDVRCILYSVPSRLIGQQIEIHLYHDRLVGYFARQQVFEIVRLRLAGKGRRRGRCIDYRHLIGSLRKKPRAFLFCKWQRDLLPTAEFRQLWGQLKTHFERDQAALLIVEALYIAATYDKEQAVCDYMSAALAEKQLTLRRLQQQFMPKTAATLPPIEAQQHSLDSYDQLLSSSSNRDNQDNNGSEDAEPNGSDSNRQSLPAAEQPAQAAQAHQHDYPLGSYREPCFAAAVVLCTVFTQLVSARHRAANTDRPDVLVVAQVNRNCRRIPVCSVSVWDTPLLSQAIASAAEPAFGSPDSRDELDEPPYDESHRTASSGTAHQLVGAAPVLRLMALPADSTDSHD